jgi:hypothetical protein
MDIDYIEVDPNDKIDSVSKQVKVSEKRPGNVPVI